MASLQAVTKHFGAAPALAGLDLTVNEGRITVLLGPNGAGKTTAIRLLTGALAPDQGTISVFGIDPAGPAGGEVRRRCGVVSAKPALYDRLSGRDNLRAAGELFGLGRAAAAEARIVEAAAWFGIEAPLDQLVGGYSTGMKTRLALARAVLHDPDLLLLDEPTSGLDPESARAVLDLVRTMTDRGRTVLLCTHLLAEADGLADEVVVVQDGTNLASGRQHELARRFWPHPEVVIDAFDRAELTRVIEHPAVVGARTTDEGVRVVLTDERAIASVVGWLCAAGVQLRSVNPWQPSLEDLYFAIRQDRPETNAEGPEAPAASINRPTPMRSGARV